LVRRDLGFKKSLREWLYGAQRVVLAGIGNSIRMDDYVGVRIVQDLAGNVSNKVFTLECETVPESFMQQIVEFHPTHVLLIDAAILGLKPGSYKLVEPEQLTGSSAVSTHMLPLRIFCDYVREATRAKISLLLIEPERSDFGEGLSSEVEASAKELAQLLLEMLPK
jgi:hydrogenase 3 maturation protease